ncbi:CIA30 family protein [filamentous cyanobacterium LEGE 11480]|uniref:CIA30 family protein n=1 Tax=Romeriopsis navalis LEGE 11480 TaxID=2777977 RepID=A0A928VMM0_9CYAN|nr:CIA30 family protein [Romeriopsis navalis]MBE9028644.1 CIA30 family protein [Romeriopsis navalis LEGE 11480]
MSNQRQNWDLGRFVQTLDYFEAIPVVSWVQKMFQLNMPPPSPCAEVQANGDKVLFNFPLITDISQTWGAVDDVVMGGVSDSKIVRSPEGAWFTGNVSTANSGGFVSVRTRNFEPALDLSTSQGIKLKVKGDGQRYKFFMRSDVGWDSVAFAYSFDTVENKWITVQVPFSEMRGVVRARTLPADVKLNTKQIRSMQLMLSKFEYDKALNPSFKPGKFSLYVESISLF